MESIIKINSSNAFAETAAPGQFKSSKLLDFTIPGNMGVIDLGSSFITINTEILGITDPAEPVLNETDQDLGLYANELVLDTTAVAGGQSVVETASLVRNAQMFSQSKGMVETIRRVDTLRQILFNLDNNAQEKKDSLDKIGTFQGRRGPDNKTSSHLYSVINNTNSAGVADLNSKSYQIAKDLRIPLKSLFGVGSQMWNSDLYGDTRINLELNINKLKIAQLGGQEDVSDTPVVGETYGQIVDFVFTDAATTPINKLELIAQYLDPALNMPFHVGQAINVVGENPLGSDGLLINSAAGLQLDGGLGYIVGDSGRATYSGSAVPDQFIWTVNTVSAVAGEVGKILTYTLDAFDEGPPYGFSVGDVIYFSQAVGGVGATLTVLDVIAAPGGVVSTTQTGTPAPGSPAIGEVVTYTNLTGTGTGFAGIIEAIAPDLKVQITNRGTGYAIGDTLEGSTPTATSGVNCTIDEVIVHGAEQINVNTIIDSISYGTAGGGSADESIVLHTRDVVAVPVSATTITGLLCKALLSDLTTNQIRLNKAEITLSLMQGVKGTNSIDYMTYVSEEVNGNNQPSFFHQYNIEPGTQNIIVGLAPSNDIAPTHPFTDYTLSFDNVDQTGNRAVEYNSNLYEDRVLRFLRNRGEQPQNVTFNMLSTSKTEGSDNATRSNQIPFYPILETVPGSGENQMLNLNINATSNQQVILYKELLKTI